MQKFKVSVFCGAIGFVLSGISAEAQSDTSVTLPDTVGTIVADKLNTTGSMSISYLGVLYGPGFSSDQNGKTKDGDDLFLHSRPTFKYQAAKNVHLGIQPRFNIRFMSEGMDAVMENWRLQSEFKNLYKDDRFAFSVTPRLSLPTSIRSHDLGMKLSPELIGKMDFAPKNSRFQFDSWYLIGNYLHDAQKGSSATTLDSTLAAEVLYQLTGDFAFTFGYYMEHAKKMNTAITSVSNEIDIGVNWDFAKGWSINPVVVTECNGIGKDGASIAKNMGLYVWVSGAVL